MKVWLTGAGYVTAGGWGRLNENGAPVLIPGPPQVPRSQDVFREPLARYGRFDLFTRLGCAAAALALRDAGLDAAPEKRPIGMVASSRRECLDTDLAFYRTALAEGGALASPNLFSYTLPGIVLGECAVCFRLTGPTASVGESPEGIGSSALATALRILEAGKADTMLAGWIEAPPPETGEPLPAAPSSSAPTVLYGSLFAVLSVRSGRKQANRSALIWCEASLWRDNSRVVSLPELLKS